MSSDQKIGLVLGGGGVRASFHIGFYEVLKENDIPISFVAGTSMGAIIGAMIAIGYDVQTIIKYSQRLQTLKVLSFVNFNYFNEGVFKREGIDNILKAIFGEKNFSDTKIPFACTAVDLETHEKVVLNSGSLRHSVAASSAYTPIFSPVFINGKYLVDGGILDAVPVKVMKEMGAEKIIAIRIKNNLVRQYISGQIYCKYYTEPEEEKGWLKRNVESFKRKKQDLKLLLDIAMENVNIPAGKLIEQDIAEVKPDFYLEPIIDFGLLDFSKMNEAIDMGREAALENLPRLKELVNK